MPTSSYPEQAGYQAYLEVRQQPDQLVVTGHCRSTDARPAVLRYEFLLAKQGPSGTSRNLQSGNVEVGAGEHKLLSQTSLNATPADSYRIRLRLLTTQGVVLAEDSLVQIAAIRP
ncbi:hypothetical protein DNI29_10125 [Hymenobacter sediminis]|uniref:curli-like amyloid fiber formation chaperone CsgH n=1 Tax=Hymenobacter sediminis TaxID=2218621 RepID=UPI000F4EB128|nr:curli-like amyloid fiber formation chaperone CsgH [Hymenobacter sediminis]RPD47790.1 hypothetical protein DNI29_10125 [Hymenobacter sediminis]